MSLSQPLSRRASPPHHRPVLSRPIPTPVSCQPGHPCLLSPVLGGRWSQSKGGGVESQAGVVDLGCYRINHCNDTLTVSLPPGNSTH